MHKTIEIFSPASHNDILALITMIAILLLVARLLGELCNRFGQPAVIGEIAAGILLGPSLLGYFFPAVVGYIIPANATQAHLLEAMSLIGAMFLLLITGLETDLPLIKHHAKTALSVSFGGIIVTFTTGFFVGQIIPDALLADKDQRLVFSLFIATAMAISAIPVIAKVLIDLKLTRRNIGQTIIAAGMNDDTCGWILLSIVTGLAAEQAITAQNIISSVMSVLFFIIASVTIGMGLAKRALDFVQDNLSGPYHLLTLVVSFMFIWGAFSQILHLEPILGAFAMGIIFGHLPRLPRQIPEQLEGITLGIFAPLFFAVAGLKVNILKIFSDPQLLKVAGIVILFASIGKIVGTYIGARFIGRKDHWSSLSFGAALNARGAMEIIIATIGLSLGILTQDMFSIIVLMAITTSLAAPFALRWILERVKPSEEEQKRIEKEQLAEKSPIQNIYRILIPLRRREEDDKLDTIQIIKAFLIQKVTTKQDLSITLLSVDLAEMKEKNLAFLQKVQRMFGHKEVIIKFVADTNIAKPIIEESKKDYDLVILGASKKRSDTHYLFSNTIDNIVRFSACPTAIIHAPDIKPGWSPKRMLVPTDGSKASQNAVEMAVLISTSQDQHISLLHVYEVNPESISKSNRLEPFIQQIDIGETILEDFKGIGELHNVDISTLHEPAPDVSECIIDTATNDGSDLIILGTDVKPTSKRLYFGPRVEKVLVGSPCPVMVLNAT